MLYSKSAEYAIRGLVYLADLPEGKFAMVKQIAEEERLPAHFLAKILQQLARQGLLQSSKGPTGGFRLRAPATNISLLTIVEAVDGLSEYQRCACGRDDCSDQAPCGARDSWKRLHAHLMEYLEGTSIALIGDGIRTKVPCSSQAAQSAQPEVRRSGRAVPGEAPNSDQAAQPGQDVGRHEEMLVAPDGKTGWRERFFGLVASRK